MARSKVQVVRAAIATAALVGLAACGSAEGSEGSTQSTAADPTLLSDGTLAVCTSYPKPPFASENAKGEIVGFDVDLAKEIAAELDVEISFSNENLADIESGKALNDDSCDIGIAGLSIDGERARVVDFSSPYFSAKQVLVVLEGGAVQSLEDLADGGRIAVQEGSTGETYAQDNKPLDSQIIPYESIEDVSSQLNGSAVDAAIFDNNLVADAIKTNPSFKVVQEFDTGEQYGIVVKKDSNVDLLRVINDVLAEMQDDGRYDEISNAWFPNS